MHSDVPPVAGRVLVLGFVLGLLVAMLPAATLAQDPEPATVSDAFEVSGDAAGADTFYRWEVVEAAGAWRLDLTGPPDERVGVELLEEDLTPLDQTAGTAAATLFDLALAPGVYMLKVPRSTRDALPFTLTSSSAPADYDPEPNDVVDTASPVAVGGSVPGRLADAYGDTDHFRFAVDAGSSALIDVDLESSGGTGRTLCLLDGDGADRSCRSGEGEIRLTDLQLGPGDHVVRVWGSARPDEPYQLRVEVAREQSPDYEAEPNDDPAIASPLDAALGVSGRSSRLDPDFHRVTIKGEPQLWRWEARGPDIDRFALVAGGGAELQAARPGSEDGTAVLDDVLLGPGQHLFRVRTLGGPYTIVATALGAPDPGAEREPNSDPLRAEPYRIGEPRTGRLTSSDDIDFMRFTLAAPEHLRFRLSQAPDADIDVQLDTGGTKLIRRWASEPGAPLELDLRLEPGDYLLRLAPRQASPDPYELLLERADPFESVVDQEPNDTKEFASEAPPGLRWSSSGQSGQDVDWYRLPALSSPSEVTFDFAPDLPRVRLFAGPDADERVDLAKEDDVRLRAVDVPADVPLFVQIEGHGSYDIEAASAGWAAEPLAPAPDVSASLAFDTTEVAAYWPQAQVVAGTLALANEGTEPVSLKLEALSSHFAWQPTITETELTLEPGEAREVGVAVEVGPSVWADDPVQITVAAGAESAEPVTASAIVDATVEAPAIASHLGWTVPSALLGGLNVASTALGGVPADTVHPDREPFLFDGATPSGGGFGVSFDSFPAELVVDLAGESAIPVAGTIINPLARGSSLREVPLSVELLLSDDGETWTTATTGEVSPLPIDQAFVLDEPMLATHAMLRVHSLWTGNSKTLALGEWKVIAEPGAVPDDMTTNIADPVRGGRVVRQLPLIGSFDYQTEILDGDPRRRNPSTHREAPGFEAIIGFQDGRAARIESLSWVDPEDSDPELRMASVDVEVSTESPLGPWQHMDEWPLPRDEGGLVEDLELEGAPWARFVRLSKDLPEGTRGVEMPAAVGVHELGTDDEYRSILGEWGYHSQQGPYEWLQPPAAAGSEPGPDAGDTRETATPLQLDTPRVDSAEILVDTDWYRIEIPADHDTLSIELSGVPNVGVELALFDAAGTQLDAESSPRPGGTIDYEWTVTSGEPYDLRVEQPPFNVVFTFDTSGSMGPYLQTVMEGVREFAADVKPGREAALIVPFEEDPLLEEWQDRPEILVDAINNYDPRANSSSGAVISLLNASELLAPRDGARAVLIVTDAETGGLDLGEDVWQSLERVQPVVYTVHVGASSIARTRSLMQSWAHANGGHYSYPSTHGEMDREFERMSTQLRRPAAYSLTATASDRRPVQLSVVAPAGQPPTLAPGVGVAIILDTSGSMNKWLDGQKRLNIAKDSMRSLVNEQLAPGVPVSLRIFGGKGKSKAARCTSRLALPLQPLNRNKTLKLVKKLKADKKTGTPIGHALRAVASDLSEVTGTRMVVLLTDGKESCDGDPTAAIEELRAAGVDVNLNIVGLALDDAGVKDQMATWADAGNGSYFDATSASELGDALAKAVAAPYSVYSADDDEPVAGGTVGGGAVVLDPGTYRVEVRSDPPIVFEDVVLGGGTSISLELPLE